MGATNFLNISSATTATRAYQAACSDATSQHGNDSYNGTISTTTGFIEIPAIHFKGMRTKTRLMILEALAMGEEELGRAPSYAALDTFNHLKTIFGRGTEKWGKCFCLQLNKSTFAFAGWAAS